MFYFLKTWNIYVKKYELMKNLEFQIFQQLKCSEHIFILIFYTVKNNIFIKNSVLFKLF